MCNQSKRAVNVTGSIDSEDQQTNHKIGGKVENSNVFIAKTTVVHTDTIKVLDSSKNTVENNTIIRNKQEVKIKSSLDKSTEYVGSEKKNGGNDSIAELNSSVDASNNHCYSSTSSTLENVNIDPVNKDINSDRLETEEIRKITKVVTMMAW